jgi:hypothetical protein
MPDATKNWLILLVRRARRRDGAQGVLRRDRVRLAHPEREQHQREAERHHHQ